MAGAAALSDRSDGYRRRARRVRGACWGRPVLMHRRLRELSTEYDRECRSVAPATYVPGNGARAFAAAVEGRVDAGGILRYSKRLELLKIARGFGIGRFEANLVIAAVQHGRGKVRPEPIRRESRTIT